MRWTAAAVGDFTLLAASGATASVASASSVQEVWKDFAADGSLSGKVAAAAVRSIATGQNPSYSLIESCNACRRL